MSSAQLPEVAGILIVLIMRMLGEMVADSPTSGAFSVYAGRAVSPAAGFAVGWLWWFQLMVVIAAEAAAAAQILVAAWPVAPQWLLALIFMIVSWTMAIISHLVLRRRADREGRRLALRAWGCPLLWFIGAATSPGSARPDGRRPPPRLACNRRLVAG